MKLQVLIDLFSFQIINKKCRFHDFLCLNDLLCCLIIKMVAAWFLIQQAMIPVIAILQDHLDVPSNTISSACSIESMCVSGSTEKVFLWKYKKKYTPKNNTTSSTQIKQREESEASKENVLMGWGLCSMCWKG